jgi:hypothetical protein
MNAPHWHLVLNHLPVAGLLFVVILLGYALVSGRGELHGVCLGALVVIGLLTIAVFYTGRGADEALMMDLSGVDEKFVEAHAKAAKTTFICMCILGGVALVVAWLGRKLPHISRSVALVIFVLSLAELVLMGRTANLGGNIRHPEIRPAQPEGAVPGAPKEEAK